MRIAVVGANGRVGGAVAAHLADRHDVVAVVREPGEGRTELAARASSGVDLVVNAAGVAHVATSETSVRERLTAANVELPSALAEAAVSSGASLVHISSVKAAESPPKGPYARSKRQGDMALEVGFADRFEAAGLSLTIIRPLAMLLPPFEAGKLARLRLIRFVPTMLVPAVGLPILSTDTFLASVDEIVESLRVGSRRAGLSWRDFERRERGTLRDVRLAFRAMG